MDAAKTAPLLKGFGYLVSIASVLLLGAVAWGATYGSPRLQLCLVAGMATSILGICLRWYSYRLEQQQKR